MAPKPPVTLDLLPETKRRRLKKVSAPVPGRLEDVRQPELPLDLPDLEEPVPADWDQRDAG